VVAQSLRQAPRLSSQRPLRIDFLITRVTASATSPEIASLIDDLGGDAVSVLPHDSAITNKESLLTMVMSGGIPLDANGQPLHRLFDEMHSWIVKSFPVHR
jgi:hypothetical protein